MRLTEKLNSGGYIIDTKLDYANSVVEMIQKYGQLEDLMEKYNIIDIGELECIIQNEEKGTDAFIEYWEKRFPELLKPYKDIEKELKALEIISKKEVNVAWFTYISSVEEYNKGKFIGSYLTEEEFDLLKEVLL